MNAAKMVAYDVVIIPSNRQLVNGNLTHELSGYWYR
jgi:hypothetical protein